MPDTRTVADIRAAVAARDPQTADDYRLLLDEIDRLTEELKTARATSDFTNLGRLAEIEARTTAKYLSSEPWRLDYESCDCGGDYHCGHGMYAQAVITPEPTPSAADRCARTGEQPKDYDFHRSEMCDFTDADWELMVHARADIPWLIAQLKQARGLAAAWMEDDARRDDELPAVEERMRRQIADDIHRARRPQFPATERPDLVVATTRAIDVRIAAHGNEAPYAVADEATPWQKAVDGLNALVDADISFHIEPDGHITNPVGDEHIEWDTDTARWVLTHDEDGDA